MPAIRKTCKLPPVSNFPYCPPSMTEHRRSTGLDSAAPQLQPHVPPAGRGALVRPPSIIPGSPPALARAPSAFPHHRTAVAGPSTIPDCPPAVAGSSSFPGCPPALQLKDEFPECPPALASLYDFPECPPALASQYDFPECPPDLALQYDVPECPPAPAMQDDFPECPPALALQYDFPECPPALAFQLESSDYSPTLAPSSPSQDGPPSCPPFPADDLGFPACPPTLAAFWSNVPGSPSPFPPASALPQGSSIKSSDMDSARGSSSRGSRASSHSSKPSRSRRRRRREPTPVFDDDLDPDFDLPILPEPYSAERMDPDPNDAVGPQAYDPALTARIRAGADARRLLSLRKRSPIKYKVLYAGQEAVVTRSAEPGEGGMVVEGEGVPDTFAPGSNPRGAFKNFKNDIFYWVEKVHARRTDPVTGEEEFQVEWSGYTERQWLPAENVAGLPDSQMLRQAMGVMGPMM